MVYVGGSWCAVPCGEGRSSGSGGVLKDHIAWTGELKLSRAGDSCRLSEFPVASYIIYKLNLFRMFYNLTYLFIICWSASRTLWYKNNIYTTYNIFNKLPFIHTVLKSKLFFIILYIIYFSFNCFYRLTMFLLIGKVKSYSCGECKYDVETYVDGSSDPAFVGVLCLVVVWPGCGRRPTRVQCRHGCSSRGLPGRAGYPPSTIGRTWPDIVQTALTDL